MNEEEAANIRLEYIQKRQELLTTAVSDAQGVLYLHILDSIEKITENPAELTRIFREFTAGPMLELMEQFISDVSGIGKQNGIYFRNITGKDYTAIQKQADDYLIERFGLNKAGEPIKEGFIDLFIKDTSIQQEARSFAYLAKTSGKGIKYFKEGFKKIIKGDQGAKGSLQKHFNTYIFDTYQQSDAVIQDIYATELNLQATLYAGVAVAGSRDFCRKRKGKVFLRSEVAAWAKLPHWAGRTEPYNPFIDRGGYGCLDGFNWITNKMALKRREDLEEINGVLQVKA